MRRVTGIKALSAFVALGLLVQPLATVQAQNAAPASSQIVDVELKSNGSFQGKPVDARGQVQPNAKVTVQNVQTGQVFRTSTAQNGTFAIESLPPGVYDVTVGQMTSTVRIWPFQAAPAGSVQQVSYQPGLEEGGILAPFDGAGLGAGTQTTTGGGIFGGTSGGGLIGGPNALGGAGGLAAGAAAAAVAVGIVIAVTAS